MTETIEDTGTDLMLPQTTDLKALYAPDEDGKTRIAEAVDAIRKRALEATRDLDMEKKADRKLRRSVAARVASSKVALDNAGKDLGEDHRKALGIINAERNTVTKELDTLRDAIRKPAVDWEEAEAQRVAKRALIITDLNVVRFGAHDDPAAIEAAIAWAKTVVVDESWGEQQAEGELSLEQALLTWPNVLTAAQKRVQDEQELAEFRAQKEREAAEAAAREAAEAAEAQHRQQCAERLKLMTDDIDLSEGQSSAQYRVMSDRLTRWRLDDDTFGHLLEAAISNKTRFETELTRLQAEAEAREEAERAEAARVAAEEAAEKARAEATAEAQRQADAAKAAEERQRQEAEAARLQRERDEVHRTRIFIEVTEALRGIPVEEMAEAIWRGKVPHLRIEL